MDSSEALKTWGGLLQRTRAYFDQAGFTECLTPHLVPAGAFEGVIDTLKVSGTQPLGELHSSPEIEMKVLLSDSGLSLYQICRCFRDDPATGIHGKEFTMLEFYEVGADYLAIQRRTEEWLQTVVGAPPAERVSVESLFRKHLGLELSQMDSRERFVETLSRGGWVRADAGDTWEDLFFKALLDHIEPKLTGERPWLVSGYPSRIAALGTVPTGSEFAERFEVYWMGMEIANGCRELSDVSELNARTKAERTSRQRAGKAPHPAPGRLMDALTRGLPPCSGVAVGLDRVFKARFGQFPPGFQPSGGTVLRDGRSG